MNIKRILNWGAFVLIIGLIVWGLIAASNKAEKESAMLAPADQVTSGDWVKGNASSTVTIIEYSDFQCPACGAYFPLVEEVTSKLGTEFKFVYRHFPLAQHANAIPASRAAEAAGLQGKFWEMYAEIFSNQSEWSESKISKEIFTNYAEKIGLDTTKFLSDYESKEVIKRVDDSIKGGVKAGVTSTPTFFLNGKKINAQTYEQFKTLIEQAATTTKNF